MSLNWIDVTNLPFNVLLLLERVQLSWLPGWPPEPELAVALRANPAVEWYFRNKCPELSEWLNTVLDVAQPDREPTPEDIRRAEIAVMQSLNDLVIYAVDPAAYHALPFHGWDSGELLSLVDFTGKTVIDVGSGTGRLALAVAAKAAHVFAVEPVTNLRDFLRETAAKEGFRNVYPVDGLSTRMPFPDNFADVTMSGHMFGGDPEEEFKELSRVTKPGGMVVLCPGNVDRDNADHQFLVSRGCQWSRFEEPSEGMKRKYWKTLD